MYDDDDNNNGIFGTFRTLTPAQIKGNAIFVASWAAAFSIIIVGVVAAVMTGIIWIGPIACIIGLCAFFLVASHRNIRYVSMFGIKYNLLRLLICGVLVYSGVAWRGLFGFYNRLRWNNGWDMSISSFGWWILAISLLITILCKLSLYRIVDVQVADFVGILELTTLGIFIGSIMFLLLYT